MRGSAVVREGVAAARSSIVPTILIALVVAATCFAAIATVGRQAATERDLAESLTGPAARVVTLTSNGAADSLTSATTTMLAGLRHVGAVVGLEQPVDAVNGALGAGSSPVAVAALHGTRDAVIEIELGRLPQADEVVISAQMMQRLGMASASGYLQSADGRQWSVVGSFIPLEPFADLGDLAIAGPNGSAPTPLLQVRVLPASLGSVDSVQRASIAIAAATPPDVQVIPATASGASSQGVTSQVAGLGRSLLMLILGAGAFFVAIVVLTDVLIRRRDLGRRRTLGITRGALVALVAVRACAPATAGALVGAVAAQVSLWWSSGPAPWDFAVAVPILASLCSALSCLIPATVAARSDPVAVMRTA